MSSPRYTILVANRNTGTVRRFTVVRRPTLLVLAGLFVVPTLVGLGAHWARKAEIDSLRSSNETLRLENESYREATGELTSQIGTLQTTLDQLSEQAQLDPATRQALDRLPRDIKSRAMGGGTLAEAVSAPKAVATSSPDGTIGLLKDLLGVLGERLKSVQSDVAARQALAAATPSLWPIAGWLSSSFGQRTDPFTGAQDFHAGLDISADRGTPVRAPADGTVDMAAYDGSYGNCVVLTHGFGIGTRFGHLSGYAVRPGQTVKRGQVIGYVGSTGRTTGPHLHYEILINGQPINPLRILAR